MGFLCNMLCKVFFCSETYKNKSKVQWSWNVVHICTLRIRECLEKQRPSQETVIEVKFSSLNILHTLGKLRSSFKLNAKHLTLCVRPLTNTTQLFEVCSTTAEGGSWRCRWPLQKKRAEKQKELWVYFSAFSDTLMIVSSTNRWNNAKSSSCRTCCPGHMDTHLSKYSVQLNGIAGTL